MCGLSVLNQVAYKESSRRIALGRCASFPHDPTDRRRAQDETDPGEHLRHPFVTHCRAQALQLPNEIPDEIGIVVDGLNGLNERTFPWLVDAPHPMKKRLQVDQKDSGRLLQVPTPSGAELENSHPLDRGVVRPTPGLGSLPAAILNSKFLPKESDLGLRLLELGLEPTAADGATPGDGHDNAGQGDGVQNPGLDVTRPPPGQVDWRASYHDGLRMNYGGAQS